MNVNGHIYESCKLEQGIKKGYPLSPLLYDLYAKILAENIRKDSQNKKIEINTIIYKVFQYADDTTLFLTSDTSFLALENTLNIYQTVTASIVNPDKCHDLWLGSNKHRIY